MASSTTSFTLKDSGFFVKNVPNSFNDWDLFNVFSKFGLVGYCRIGGNSVQDKNSQFGFVNMLSVSDADSVRNSLKNGFLQTNSCNIQVSDFKCSNSIASNNATSKSSPAVRIPSMWLPLNEEIMVDVVNYLPCSSVKEDIFQLTIKKIEDASLDATYEALNEKLNQWMNLIKFEGDVQIGYDCVYKEASKKIRRARRISVTKLYLIDEGRIVEYEKSKCFVIPSKCIYIPTRVALCTIDGLIWSKAAIASFDKIRSVIQQWKTIEGTKLKAKNLGFSGPLNSITLYCGESILSQRLQRKGICEYIPRNSIPLIQYSREEMLERRNEKNIPKISEDKDVIEELIVDIENLPIK